MENSSVLRKGCEHFHISLSDGQERKFIKYYELLAEWNQVMNLTAITEYDEVMQKHFVDSLAAFKGYRFIQMSYAD